MSSCVFYLGMAMGSNFVKPFCLRYLMRDRGRTTSEALFGSSRADQGGGGGGGGL